jgi:hypothetical protein
MKSAVGSKASRIVELAKAGMTNDEIANTLTAEGWEYRKGGGLSKNAYVKRVISNHHISRSFNSRLAALEREFVIIRSALLAVANANPEALQDTIRLIQANLTKEPPFKAPDNVRPSRLSFNQYSNPRS